MDEHSVVIAGGGPTGMMLAAELALADVDVVVVEPRTNHELDSARSRGLHARTLEVLDQRGIVERFLEAGQPMQVQAFGGTPVDISDFPTRHPYGLALWQREFERLLGGWVDELGVPTLRGVEVVGLTQLDDGVDVELSDGGRLRTSYLAGCDGGHSVVRKAAGIDFPGAEATTSWLIAEVEMDDVPPLGLLPQGGGIGLTDVPGQLQVLLVGPHVPGAGAPTLDELRSGLVGAYGTDFGAHSPRSLSRFTDATRQAATYRAGRVLLAGDAAHVHPPQGGQGLNTGVQDAVNLGWKLAQVVKGTSPEALLDSYHAERHPVGARVLHNTMAQVALTQPGDRHEALRDILGELLAMDQPRRHVAAMLSGLDIRYDLGGGHPVVGWRVPDVDLMTAEGRTRPAELLCDARPLLVDLGGAARAGAERGRVERRTAAQVRVVVASCDDRWELPVIGEVPAPRAVLVRPDGHVAWAGDPDDPALSTASATWFGAEVA